MKGIHRFTRIHARLSVFLVAGALALTSVDSNGQSLGETLNNVGSQYGSMYTTPLTNSLGADLNSGLFHTAKSAKGLFGVNIFVGIKAAGMMVNTQDQYFDLAFPSTVEFDYTIDGSRYTLNLPAEFEVNGAPTVFGDRSAPTATAHILMDTTIVHEGNPVDVAIDTTFSQSVIGGLWKTQIAPLIIPHASIGSIFGTDLVVRYLPEISHPDYGHVKLRGLGFRHSISRHIPMLPVDVAVSAVWQQLETQSTAVGNFTMNLDTRAYSVIVSKELLLVTVYGGFQRERSTVDYSYEFVDLEDVTGEAIDVSFSHQASLKNRAVLGVTLNLGPLVTNFDFSMGEERVASAGLGFGF